VAGDIGSRSLTRCKFADLRWVNDRLKRTPLPMSGDEQKHTDLRGVCRFRPDSGSDDCRNNRLFAAGDNSCGLGDWITTHWISLLKDTGALVVLGIGELTTVAKVLSQAPGSYERWVTVLVLAGALYLAATLALFKFLPLVLGKLGPSGGGGAMIDGNV